MTVPTYSPQPPWTNGQAVIRNTDGVLFTYSKTLNALTIKPNVSGIAKDAGNYIIKNLPTPSISGDAANKAYVDTHGGIPEAPTDSGTYARQNTAWVKIYDGGAY